MERPGHILGRVCHIPSSNNSIQFVHTRYIRLESKQGYTGHAPDLFALSPEIMEQFCPYTELKTVYIPHPQSNSANSNPLWSL